MQGDIKVRLALAAGAAAFTPVPASAKPPLEGAPAGLSVAPLSIAKVRKIDGRIALDGEWTAYGGGGGAGPRSDRIDAPFFDSYGRRPALANDCTPGTGCVGSCDTSPDSGGRWYFGTGYHNPNTIEDMQDCACPPRSVISEIDLGFMWAPPSPSPCIIVYFPYEEVLNFDLTTGLCDDEDGFTDTGGGGIALDFGVLPPSRPYYYFACVPAIESIGCLSPDTDDNNDPSGYADGSYQQIFAESLTSTGLILARGPCQPMLWGTSTNGTGPADCRPGHNNEDSYDDDAPTDGVLSNPAECYSYIHECPSPLGKDNCFGYRRCPADFNNDGFVDGIDADSFNNTFGAAPGFNQQCGDLNGDCFVDGLDADLFFNEFESACP